MWENMLTSKHRWAISVLFLALAIASTFFLVQREKAEATNICTGPDITGNVKLDYHINCGSNTIVVDGGHLNLNGMTVTCDLLCVQLQGTRSRLSNGKVVLSPPGDAEAIKLESGEFHRVADVEVIGLSPFRTKGIEIRRNVTDSRISHNEIKGFATGVIAQSPSSGNSISNNESKNNTVADMRDVNATCVNRWKNNEFVTAIGPTDCIE